MNNPGNSCDYHSHSIYGRAKKILFTLQRGNRFEFTLVINNIFLHSPVLNRQPTGIYGFSVGYWFLISGPPLLLNKYYYYYYYRNKMAKSVEWRERILNVIVYVLNRMMERRRRQVIQCEPMSFTLLPWRILIYINI